MTENEFAAHAQAIMGALSDETEAADLTFHAEKAGMLAADIVRRLSALLTHPSRVVQEGVEIGLFATAFDEQILKLSTAKACDAGVTPLDRALGARLGDYADALDRVRDLEEVSGSDARLLREAVEMVRVLRKMASKRSTEEIHSAFGAPGEWGYDSPIGDALYRLYRGAK